MELLKELLNVFESMMRLGSGTHISDEKLEAIAKKAGSFTNFVAAVHKQVVGKISYEETQELLKFYDNLPHIKAIREELTEGWHRSGSTFTAELSDLSEVGKRSDFTTGRLKCPGCKEELPKPSSKEWKKDMDGSQEDIYGWNMSHSCGAKILVIND